MGGGIVVVAHVTGKALWLVMTTIGSFVAVGSVAVATVMGHALRHLSRSVAILAGHVRVTVETVAGIVGRGLRRLWLAAAVAGRHAGRARAAIAVVIGDSLWHSWQVAVLISRFTGRRVAWVATMVGRGLRLLWQGVALVSHLAGLGFASVTVVAGRGLRQFWQGVVWTSRLADRGVTLVAVVIGRGLRQLWWGVAKTGRLVGGGIALVAVEVSRGLQLLGQGIVMASRPAGRGAVAIATGAGQGLRHISRGFAWTSRFAGRAITVAALASGRALLKGTLVLSHYVVIGVVTAVFVIGRMLFYLRWAAIPTGRFLRAVLHAMGAAALQVLSIVLAGLVSLTKVLLQGSVVAMTPVRRALPYVSTGLSAMAGQLSHGMLMVVRAMGEFAALLGRSTSLMVLLLVKSPHPAFSTARVGTAAAPDLLRFGVSMVTHRKGISPMSESNLTRDRMVSLVVTSLVFFLVTAGAVRVAIELWPAPAEPPVTVVHWVTGHLYYGPDLPGMAKSFNATNPTTKDGKRIEIGIFDAPSSEGARELIARVTGLGSRDISLGAEAGSPGPHDHHALRRTLAGHR